MSVVDDTRFIAVLTDVSRSEWVLQELNVPIPVALNARVLLRLPGLSDNDCTSLADELRLLAPAAPSKSQITQDANRSRPTTVAVKPTTSAPSPPPQHVTEVVSTGDAVSRPIVPLRFPLTYVCEMADGMKALSWIFPR